MFGYGKSSVPAPDPGEPVREFDFIWSYAASDTGKCKQCFRVYQRGDELVALGRRDCEAKTVICGGCWAKAKEAA